MDCQRDVMCSQVCEKALADYMESKRRAFPRFYFVSTADLLDILSNGNNPVKVCWPSSLLGSTHASTPCFLATPANFSSHLLLGAAAGHDMCR
jgi:hypothetical protein